MPPDVWSVVQPARLGSADPALARTSPAADDTDAIARGTSVLDATALGATPRVVADDVTERGVTSELGLRSGVPTTGRCDCGAAASRVPAIASATAVAPDKNHWDRLPELASGSTRAPFPPESTLTSGCFRSPKLVCPGPRPSEALPTGTRWVPSLPADAPSAVQSAHPQSREALDAIADGPLPLPSP